MGLRPTKTNENAGILRCFRISSLARTFKGAKSTLMSLSSSAHWNTQWELAAPLLQRDFRLSRGAVVDQFQRLDFLRLFTGLEK